LLSNYAVGIVHCLIPCQAIASSTYISSLGILVLPLTEELAAV
jgi:hypothetical protein